MKKNVLISIMTLSVMACAMLYLHCEIFDPPTAPEKTKVSVVFIGSDDKFYEGSLIDSIGKQIDIGAALYLPDNFDSLSFTMYDGDEEILDTMFRTFKDGYFYDTAWVKRTFWTPGVRNLTITPYVTPARSAIVATITIKGLALNAAPEWAIDTLRKTIKVATSFSMDLSTICREPNKDNITYTLIPGDPENDTIIGTTYSITPILKDIGNYIAQIRASDPENTFSILPVKLRVDTIVQDTQSQTHSVIYQKGTGVSGDVPTDAKRYLTEELITIAENSGNLVKTGFTFAGWNTKEDGSGTIYNCGTITKMGSSNFVLFPNWTNNPTYKITYNGNGNTGGTVPVDSNIYLANSMVTAKSNTGLIVKIGAVFAGWNTTADGSGTAYAEGATFSMGSTNTTLYAQWKLQSKFTLTYHGNTNTAGAAPVDTGKYETGATVSVKDNTGNMVKVDYTFVGWNTAADGSGTAYASGVTFAMGTANVTLYAQWTIKPTFTVTYNGNGNTGGAVPVDENKYVAAATVTVKDNTGLLVKTGTTFAGWNTAADGSGTTYAGGGSFPMGSANIVLYAKWTTKQIYSVTFNSNGGSGTMADLSIESGASMPLIANTFTKSGSVFSGWATTATGTTVEYADKASYTMGGSNVNLYAIWSQNATYKITFNSNGGTGTMADQSIVQGLSAPLTANAFAKEGSVFAGWASTATATTVEYADKASYTMGGANVTLYAIWSQNAAYKITFNSNGGTGTMADQSIIQGISAPLTANAFTKTGSVFAGWASTATATTVEFADKASYTMGGSNVTLYAIWSQNAAYKITFNSNTGTGTMADQSIVQGMSAPLTANAFIKAGWTFDGWATSATGTVAYRDGVDYTMGSANVTLYAIWKQNSYTITFNKNDAAASGTMATQTIGSGSSAALTANAYTKTGWTFSGWATSSTGTVEYSNSANYTMGTANVTLYAKWTQNMYLVTFNKNDAAATGTMATQSIAEGTTVSLSPNSFVKQGWSFAGWATSASGAAVYEDQDNYQMENANVTLYAKWTPQDFSVTFNKNDVGATGTMTNQLIACGSSSPLKANTFTKNGWTFAGWATSASGTVLYQNQQSFTMGSSNVTLYAKWTANNYTITFDKNNSDASRVMPQQTIACGSTANLIEFGFEDGCRKFVGWSSSPSGPAEFSDKGSYTMGAANVRLYAIWAVTPLVVSPAEGQEVNHCIMLPITINNPCVVSYVWHYIVWGEDHIVPQSEGDFSGQGTRTLTITTVAGMNIYCILTDLDGRQVKTGTWICGSGIPEFCQE